MKKMLQCFYYVGLNMAFGRQQLQDDLFAMQQLLKTLYQQPKQRNQRSYESNEIQPLKLLIVDTLKFEGNTSKDEVCDKIVEWYNSDRGQWANSRSLVPLKIYYQHDLFSDRHKYALEAQVRLESLTEFLLKFA
jgi:hypothetical protein